MGQYDDIIHLGPPRTGRHPPMARENRAKQFMPFAALKGYDEELAERREIYDRFAPLTEEERDALDQRLWRLAERLRAGERPLLMVTVFDPVEGEWGHYRTLTGQAERLRLAEKSLTLSGERIDPAWIVRLEGMAGDELSE